MNLSVVNTWSGLAVDEDGDVLMDDCNVVNDSLKRSTQMESTLDNSPVKERSE